MSEKNSQSSKQENRRIKLTGLHVKQNRLKKGWSQEMLANRVNDITGIPISKHAISKWERYGDKDIKADPWNINALKKLFNDNNHNSYDLFTSLIKKYGHIETKIKLEGRYYSKWGFDNKFNDEVIEFISKENIIIGKIINGAIKYELYGFIFTNRIFSGFWININDGHIGSVLLEFSYDYEKATGNWIGTLDEQKRNKNEYFKYGYWELKKMAAANTQYKKLGK